MKIDAILGWNLREIYETTRIGLQLALAVYNRSHTALLHLNPLPKAICQIRSPFFIRPDRSMNCSSYQTEEEDVLPYLYSVARDGST